MTNAAMLDVSREEARREVGRILVAQEDLAYFSEYMSMDDKGAAWFHAYPVHRLIAYELQLVLRYLETDGQEGTQFLMVLVPFQHGKSTLVSRFFPAYALGKLPDLRILGVSYGADLASEHSRYVRNMILSSQYQSVFGKFSPSEEPVILAADSKAAAAWDLAAPHRGGMIAAGVGGSIPGRAKGLGIFDDPIKGHRESQSQDTRDDAWDFYISALRVRMIAGVLVMTHWHPDDPAGRIIRDMVLKPNGDKWRILMLPGIIEDGMFAADREEQRKRMLDGVYLPLRDPLGRSVGEVLCPAMLTKAEMMKIRETQGDYYFSALVQQTPYLRDGGMFKRDYFDIVEHSPEKVLARVMFWDKAGTRKRTGDKAAGVLGSIDEKGDIYIEYVVARRMTPYECEDTIVRVGTELYEQYGPFEIWHQQDPGSSGLHDAMSTNDNLANAKLIGHYETVTGSKSSRAGTFSTKAEAGRVHLVRGAWNQSFQEALVAFTGNDGDPDDEADAASSMVNKLLEKARKKPRQQARSWQG